MKYFCVVDFNAARNRIESYHMCSTKRQDAERLAERMRDRGRRNIRITNRKTKPSGVESKRNAFSRWGLR